MQIAAIPQGDVRLLDSDVARRLLDSTELARAGVIDFQTRFPGGGGVEEFQERGR